MDFVATTTATIVFPIGSVNGSILCLFLTLTDDDRVEYDETFSITLTVDNPLDTINGNNTTQADVTIVDNDGTCLCWLRMYSVTIGKLFILQVLVSHFQLALRFLKVTLVQQCV